MLDSCAAFLANQLMRHGEVEEVKRPILTYGIKLFLSTMASTISICILSLLFQAFYTFLVFVVVFMSTRLFAGGYHAKTYRRCFLLTNSIYLLVYVFSILIPAFIQNVILPIIILGSAVTIIILAPIRHKNHPLTVATYKKNQKIAWIITLLISGTLLLMEFLIPTTCFLPFASITLMAVAVMMIIPKLMERRM